MELVNREMVSVALIAFLSVQFVGSIIDYLYYKKIIRSSAFGMLFRFFSHSSAIIISLYIMDGISIRHIFPADTSLVSLFLFLYVIGGFALGLIFRSYFDIETHRTIIEGAKEEVVSASENNDQISDEFSSHIENNINIEQGDIASPGLSIDDIGSKDDDD